MTLKTILIIALLFIAFHLLLFSYLRRRIAVAKAKALTADPVRVEGGCHCGAVRFSFNTRPNVELLDCNCSICSATGLRHLIIPHDDFTLLSGQDGLTSYRFGTRTAHHLFCATCGVKSFYQPRSHPGSWSVNFNCLDEGHGLYPVIAKFDGKNWDEAKANLEGSTT